MPKETMFTLKLDRELRDQFMAEAHATHRPASQVVRDLMRDSIRRQQEIREHDAGFRAEVEQGMREAAHLSVKGISHEDVAKNWRRQRAECVKREGQKAG